MQPEQEIVTVDMVMPMFSETMIEGTIVEWLKEVGESIRSGEDLVEVETDKATMVYASDTTGELVEIVAEEGETLDVGSVIARIAVPQGVASAPDVAIEIAEPPEDSPPPQPPPKSAVNASPTAVTLAARLGIDLAGVAGSGPGGQIGRKDVEAARDGGRGSERSKSDGRSVAAGEKGTVTLVALNAIQRTAARRLSESAARLPQFDLSAELDVGIALAVLAELRSDNEADDGARVPTLGDLVVRLVAVALREHPLLNASFNEDDQGLELFSRRNVGVAVSTDQGLLVPTVFDADHKSIVAIAATTKELADKARAGTLTASELGGGTFTVSNLGMYGVDQFTALINPPQSGILAVGAARQHPIIGPAGTVETTSIMTVTLGCDHRAMQGTDGAMFLVRLRELFADPAPHLS
jgi:pyruvate dehydrogenase E2 component (dihydrolipoamide acetyltransferase)